MRVLSRQLVRRIALEERRAIMDALQAAEAREHEFLATPGFVRRHRGAVEWGGRILVAVLLASFTVFFNYLLFVRMLHYQFEFWR